jgi:hypothetical protein
MENHKKQFEGIVNWVSIKSYKDEATYNKIHRHLTDINDIISEEDIRNIKIYGFSTETELNTIIQKTGKTIH